mmetsp:Transcript_36183/g.81323  ORF Transcript_36183/g.81323 Transcript_36183/m.81323 type:complete len:206 (+) Transcript_36183:105-722(+)
MPFQPGNKLSQKRTSTEGEAAPAKRERNSEEQPWTRDQLVVKERIFRLGELKPDFWVLLSNDPAVLKKHLHIPTIPKLIDIDLMSFRRVVDSRPGRLWSSHGVGWASVFRGIGLGYLDITKNFTTHGRKGLQWVNFSSKPTGTPLELLEAEKVRVLHYSRMLSGVGGTLSETDSEEEEEEGKCAGTRSSRNCEMPAERSAPSTEG